MIDYFLNFFREVFVQYGCVPADNPGALQIDAQAGDQLQPSAQWNKHDMRRETSTFTLYIWILIL